MTLIVVILAIVIFLGLLLPFINRVVTTIKINKVRREHPVYHVSFQKVFWRKFFNKS